ncbi:HPP family protein [Streptomyces sp. NBC_01298]|uniref:HPP family protein n=1 Tax=Streptomyces sp. NBC_01298 TaxID=2903817 RepID=UPI002E111D02|nr:HPP family protein [Streptomyces sp. NBC_01298]
MSTALHPASSPDASGSPEASGSPGAEVPGAPRRRMIGGRAPARPTAAAAIHSISAATAVLLWLVAVGAMIHEPILIPPLAASAALVHSAPTLPLAQPRGVIIGHMVGAAVGYGVLAVAGSSAWGAAVAAGVTLALVMAARTPHSPACATAVVVVLQSPVAARFVPLLFGSTVLIVLTGYAASRIRRKAPRYPAYWW